jgi:hypothetical protein
MPARSGIDAATSGESWQRRNVFFSTEPPHFFGTKSRMGSSSAGPHPQAEIVPEILRVRHAAKCGPS